MIEAITNGKPTIAWRAGSVPEIIDDGIGFLVSSVEGAVEAVCRLPSLLRASIRGNFERRFTAARMARDFVGIYQKVRTPSRSLDAAIDHPWRRFMKSQVYSA